MNMYLDPRVAHHACNKCGLEIGIDWLVVQNCRWPKVKLNPRFRTSRASPDSVAFTSTFEPKVSPAEEQICCFMWLLEQTKKSFTSPPLTPQQRFWPHFEHMHIMHSTYASGRLHCPQNFQKPTEFLKGLDSPSQCEYGGISEWFASVSILHQSHSSPLHI